MLHASTRMSLGPAASLHVLPASHYLLLQDSHLSDKTLQLRCAVATVMPIISAVLLLGLKGQFNVTSSLPERGFLLLWCSGDYWAFCGVSKQVSF
jgi:hypothetical protein